MNPIPRFCDLLYGSRPAEFTCAFELEDSVERHHEAWLASIFPLFGIAMFLFGVPQSRAAILN